VPDVRNLAYLRNIACLLMNLVDLLTALMSFRFAYLFASSKWVPAGPNHSAGSGVAAQG